MYRVHRAMGTMIRLGIKRATAWAVAFFVFERKGWLV